MLVKKSSIKTSNKSKNFWIYGKHSIKAALMNPKRKINKLILSDKNLLLEFDPYTKLKNTNVRIEKPSYIGSFLNDQINHQNCIAEVEYLAQPALEDIIIDKNALIILLDQITDPHNVGAIIRSAAAFGAQAVISTNDGSASESAALLKAAAGTFEIMPYIKVVNLSNCIKFLKQKNFWCIGLDVNTNQLIDSVSLPNKSAFVMGSEDKGLRQLTKKNCDILIKLPISCEVESLNVSNAAAIALYEYQRQIKLKC